VADGKNFRGAVREGEREPERERCGAMRKRGERNHEHDYRKKRKLGPRDSVQERFSQNR